MLDSHRRIYMFFCGYIDATFLVMCRKMEESEKKKVWSLQETFWSWEEILTVTYTAEK